MSRHIVPAGNRELGFTLIELLIAMVIAIIIGAAVYIIYVSTRSSYRFAEASARTQETIRYAFDSIAYDLRHVGHVGCNSGLTPNGVVGSTKMAVHVNTSDAWAKYTDPIRGYSASVLPAGVFLPTEVKAGTDILWVQYFSSKHWPLTNAGAPATGTFQVLANPGDFADANILLLADCQRGDMFAATDVVAPAVANSPATIGHAVGTYNTTDSFSMSKSYDRGAELMRFVSRVYFIGTSSDGLPVLKRKNLVGLSLVDEEVADGIADMQIRYGIDKNGDGYADQYLVFSDVGATEWPSVVSTQICLLYQSRDDKIAEKKSGSATEFQSYYDCSGSLVDATDRRIRQAVTSTATFRNRVE